MANQLPPPRNSLIIQVHERLLQVLQESAASERQLRPDEGIIAVELLFQTLFNNGMSDAPPELLEDVRRHHMRVVTRISSRIVAWPAKTHQRM